MTDKKPSTKGWDDFAGEYLKTDLIQEFPVKLVVKNIETEYSKDDKPMLLMETEYRGRSWKLNLNKTNQMFLRNNGIKSPNDIVGKTLTFEKTKVRNPATNSMVDSFLINKIE